MANTSVYFPQGGQSLEVAKGGAIDYQSGSSTTLPNGSVTFAKAAAFLSIQETGTGAAQNIAHGLGATPSAVLIVPTDTSGTMTPGSYVITYTKNSTNVVVTATTALKYVVFAWK